LAGLLKVASFPNDVMAELAVQRLGEAGIAAMSQKQGALFTAETGVGGETAVFVNAEDAPRARTIMDMTD
jgi:hypothetical protein